jgi:hypothetical protein
MPSATFLTLAPTVAPAAMPSATTLSPGRAPASPLLPAKGRGRGRGRDAAAGVAPPAVPFVGICSGVYVALRLVGVPPSSTHTCDWVIVRESWQALREQQLSVTAGTTAIVLERPSPWWLLVSVDNNVGLIPTSIVGTGASAFLSLHLITVRQGSFVLAREPALGGGEHFLVVPSCGLKDRVVFVRGVGGICVTEGYLGPVGRGVGRGRGRGIVAHSN